MGGEDLLTVDVGGTWRQGAGLGAEAEVGYEPTGLSWPIGGEAAVALAPDLLVAKGGDWDDWQHLLLGIGSRATLYLGDGDAAGWEWLPWIRLPLGYAADYVGGHFTHYGRAEVQVAPFQYSWEDVVRVAPVLGGGGLIGAESIPYGFVGVSFGFPVAPPPPLVTTDSVDREERLPPVPLRELVPGHNRLHPGRANLVFVGVRFQDGPEVSREAFGTLARQMIDDSLFRAVPADNPFVGSKDRFNFWMVEEIPVVRRLGGELCSVIGLAADDYNERTRAIRQQNPLGDIYFVTLLADPEQCRAQGAWLDITRMASLGEALSSGLGSEGLLRALTAGDLRDLSQIIQETIRGERFLSTLFPRLEAPVAWVGILGEDGTIDPDTITVGRHEVGHLFHLWDEYEEAGVSDNPELEGILASLDRNYSVAELTDLAVRHIPSLQPLWEEVRPLVPAITVHPLELVATSPVAQEIFGGPLGYPNCAPSEPVAAEWWRDVTDQGAIEPTTGCLYDDQHFVRSRPTSVMRNSHDPTAPFGPVNAHFIGERLQRYSP